MSGNLGGSRLQPHAPSVACTQLSHSSVSTISFPAELELLQLRNKHEDLQHNYASVQDQLEMIQ